MSNPVFEPDPVFEVGDVVVCVSANGYTLPRGKQYVVVKYEAEYPDSAFTWPAYVTIQSDQGRLFICHAYRFKKVENAEQV